AASTRTAPANAVRRAGSSARAGVARAPRGRGWRCRVGAAVGNTSRRARSCERRSAWPGAARASRGPAPGRWRGRRRADGPGRLVAQPRGRSQAGVVPAWSGRRAALAERPDQALLCDAHHEPPVAGEEPAEGEAARAVRSRALLRIEQPLVGAERAV